MGLPASPGVRRPHLHTPGSYRAGRAASSAKTHSFALGAQIAHVTPADLNLTGRQLDVLALLMQGKGNKAICRVLNLAEPTVKKNVAAILKALRKRPGDGDLPEAP
jgi:DNA-binding NarL/FixJ family response regulator